MEEDCSSVNDWSRSLSAHSEGQGELCGGDGEEIGTKDLCKSVKVPLAQLKLTAQDCSPTRRRVGFGSSSAETVNQDLLFTKSHNTK